ncbi:MAG: undecaprenyl-diphosphate phosphatase [bacterium]
MSGHLSWAEAGVIGLLQGVSELFPVSSLGHSILLPAIIGGSWKRDLDVSAPESPYLAFIVGLHVATALALIVYFRRDWTRILGGLVTSIRFRRVNTPEEKLAWLLILATIPVGITGLLLEHTFRTVLAKPNPTAVFLMINGVVLLVAERYRRRSVAGRPTDETPAAPSAPTAPSRFPTADPLPKSDGRRESVPSARVATGTPTVSEGEATDRRLSAVGVRKALIIGSAQIAALAPGISRSGAAIAAGLVEGLDHEDAARFSFLLATPVILAAGVLKLPDLAGPLGDGIRGQVLLGSVLSFFGAYASVAFLSRYFRSNSLRPFGIYCLIFGALALVLVNR